MDIIWKKVNDHYEVSNTGLVRTFSRYVTRKNSNGDGYHKLFFKSIILKQFEDKDGYLKISPPKEGPLSVHRIVASAFLENHNNYPEVNHIDGNKKNNSITNLEWCTSHHNSKHKYSIGLQRADFENNGRAVFNNNEVLEIKKLLSEGFSPKEISEAFGYKRTTISSIKIGRTWRGI